MSKHKNGLFARVPSSVGTETWQKQLDSCDLRFSIEIEDSSLEGSDAMWIDGCMTFWRNLLPPSSVGDPQIFEKYRKIFSILGRMSHIEDPQMYVIS
jgi:hypothetical protein